MTTTNNITGDAIKSRVSSESYRSRWDLAFKKEKEVEQDNLYSFYVDCHRMGYLNGLFIAAQSEIDDLIGKTVYFGEVLGKHSEVVVDIEEHHVKLLSADQEKVAWLKELLGETVSGFNPIHVYNDQKDEKELL